MMVKWKFEMVILQSVVNVAVKRLVNRDKNEEKNECYINR